MAAITAITAITAIDAITAVVAIPAVTAVLAITRARGPGKTKVATNMKVPHMDLSSQTDT